MSEALFPYYERELLFVRRFAQDFARRYPASAGRLLLDAGRSADPHIERLIESFALLTARVQHKLDDEFPELTDALLSVLYPHYLAPMTIIFAALSVMGVRHFRHYSYAGIAAGRRFTQMIPLVLIFCIGARVAMGGLHTPLQALDSGHLFTSWCCGNRNQVDQTAVTSELPPGGKHLIVVRYRPWHDFVAQWIYNEPDIDSSRVVWARELGEEQDGKLLRYFHDRKVWLFEPDLTPPQLKPYAGAIIHRNASTVDSAGSGRALARGATTWGQAKTPDHPQRTDR